MNSIVLTIVIFVYSIINKSIELRIMSPVFYVFINIWLLYDGEKRLGEEVIEKK